MNSVQFKKRVEELIKSDSVRLVFVATYEEGRLSKLLREVATTLNLKYVEWELLPKDEPIKQIIEELTSIEAVQSIIWYGKDVYYYWDEPLVRRLLFKLSGSLQNRLIVISHPFLSPDRVLSVEAEFLSLPLPTYEERLDYIKELFSKLNINVDNWVIETFSNLLAGLTYTQILRILKRLALRLLNNRSEESRWIESLLEEKKKVLSKSSSIEIVEVDVGLEEIGGLEELKRWVKRRFEAFSVKAREFGLPQPRGLLITGIQGCGKSLFAKSIAKVWRLPLLRLDFNRLFASLSPEGELELSLHIAELNAPVILWVDEIDKLFIKESSGERLQRVLARFLTWLQEKRSPVFVVATANKVDVLPPELVRRGRFDDLFFVDLPDEYERGEIFKVHLKKVGREPSCYDIDKLSQQTEYFTGAEIEQVILSSLFRAYSENRELTQGDIEKEIKNTVPLYFTYEEEIKKMREWAKGRARFATIDRKKLSFFDKY